MNFRLIIFPAIAMLALASCATRTATSAAQAPADMPEMGAPAKRSWLKGATSSIGELNPFNKKRSPLAALPDATGKVRSVNHEHAFVLIEGAAAAGLKAGAELYTTGAGQETATLRVTQHRHGSFVLADIIEGRPSQGDAVHAR